MKYLYASIFILIFGFLGFLAPLQSGAQWLFAPFQFGLRQMAGGINDSAAFFANLDAVRRENLRLREDIINLHSTVVELKKAEEENEILREQLGIETELDRKLLLAHVMGNPQDLTGTSFILDRGSYHGVQAGDNVVKGNSLIGIVREVSPQRSLADFITSPSVAIAVLNIDVAERTEGLAEGQFGSSIIMKRILPGEEINPGDSIITSGRDGIFLPGLLVGRVTEVIEVPADPLKSAYVETIVDLGKVDRVFVLIE
jgi:rod shape-determining protein MreC